MKRKYSRFSRYFPAHLLILFVALMLPAISSAAINAFMQLQCNGSDIEGDSTFPGVENYIELVSFGANVSIPFDPASGGRVGTHSYRPIRVLKRVDKSTPLIFQALTTGQSCNATIKFFRPDNSIGTMEHFFTVQLEQAYISSIMPTLHSTLDINNVSLPVLESLSIIFGVITITYEDGGITHTDFWGRL